MPVTKKISAKRRIAKTRAAEKRALKEMLAEKIVAIHKSSNKITAPKGTGAVKASKHRLDGGISLPRRRLAYAGNEIMVPYPVSPVPPPPVTGKPKK